MKLLSCSRYTLGVNKPFLNLTISITVHHQTAGLLGNIAGAALSWGLA